MPTQNSGKINLKWVAAPMVNQSDLPFRLLVRGYEYLEYHIRDLSQGAENLAHPVVAQLCGNDPNIIVQAGRRLQPYCDAIDLNLGCPQDAAKDGHFGGYLLDQKDWQRVEGIVSAMSHSFTVPVSAKLRLCQPPPKTADLAERLEAAGASWITLHARTVSARRRRRGAADLDQVKRLKEHLNIPVISNGNVRSFSDLEENLLVTGADGLMVGETLLGNPCLFGRTDGSSPDPVDISLEYLSICRTYPGTMMSVVQTHIRHFVEFQCGRRSWFPKFRAALAPCTSLDTIEHLLKVKVERWRGRPPRSTHPDQPSSDDEGDREAGRHEYVFGDLELS